MKHANKIIAIVAQIVLACVLSKLSCYAQTPLQAFREYRTNLVGPVIEHQDGTNLVKTQAFQVLEITTVLHSQGSRVIRDAPTLLSVPSTDALSRSNLNSVRPPNQQPQRGGMRGRRGQPPTNAPAIKK